MPAALALLPISAWSSLAPGPSSPMSPRTRIRVPGWRARTLMAAVTESGLAL